MKWTIGWQLTTNELLIRQMFIPNLTANTMYEVKVRGATRSQQEPSQMYKGPFSEPRKVLLHPWCSRQGKCTEVIVSRFCQIDLINNKLSF